MAPKRAIDMSREELEALAVALTAELRSIRERIPDFMAPHKSQPKLTGIASVVPIPALESTMAVVEGHPVLRHAIDAPQVECDRRYTMAFSDVFSEASFLTAGLDYTMRYKRFRNGQAALQVFHIARRMVKSDSSLKVYVEQMAKALRSIRRRRKAAQEPEPAAEG